MQIKTITGDFTVCQVADFSQVDFNQDFVFPAKTDQELSLVCPTKVTPSNATQVDDGWSMFRIEGVLDFSLIGILAKIAELLAKEGISIFAISTYNTDYILTKTDKYQAALDCLAAAGYEIS